MDSASAGQGMSVQTLLSASEVVEIVDADCPSCKCPKADLQRSYAAEGTHAIIQLGRFRFDENMQRTKVVPCYQLRRKF